MFTRANKFSVTGKLNRLDKMLTPSVIGYETYRHFYNMCHVTFKLCGKKSVKPFLYFWADLGTVSCCVRGSNIDYFWPEVGTCPGVFPARKTGYFWWDLGTVSCCVWWDKTRCFFTRPMGNFKPCSWQQNLVFCARPSDNLKSCLW